MPTPAWRRVLGFGARVFPPMGTDMSASPLPRRDRLGHDFRSSGLAPARMGTCEPGWTWRRRPALRKLCARVSCRGITQKRSDYCVVHDVHRQRARSKQIRRGTGRPPTPTELAKLYRADAKNLWQRRTWMPMATIWLAPKFEANFVEDCRCAGMPLPETAPVVLNILRWAWRRSVLNYR